jgi:hydroxymethylglutaryl-CoA reductase
MIKALSFNPSKFETLLNIRLKHKKTQNLSTYSLISFQDAQGLNMVTSRSNASQSRINELVEQLK